MTRQVVDKVDWDCRVFTLFRDDNIGCSLGPRTAFDWFFSHETEGIILEDDCLPQQSFYSFCEELLERHRHDDRVIGISGCNLGYELKNGNSYTFSRIMNMWGWATWKRAADQIDYELSAWGKVKYKNLWCYKNLRQHLLDTDINWYKYWTDKFDRTIYGENITWWDWQWIFHQLRHRQLAIVPKLNLVRNIGFNEEATHTLSSENPAADMETYQLDFPLTHPVKIRPDLEYEETRLKWVLFNHKRLPWHFYLKHYLKRVFSKA